MPDPRVSLSMPRAALNEIELSITLTMTVERWTETRRTLGGSSAWPDRELARLIQAALDRFEKLGGSDVVVEKDDEGDIKVTES